MVVIGKRLTWWLIFSHHSHHLIKSMVGTEISDGKLTIHDRRPLETLNHHNFNKMSLQGQQAKPLATAAAAPPSLLTQVGMAGTAAVITVSFIHPMDVVKVCP
jgi:hypothetical protein